MLTSVQTVWRSSLHMRGTTTNAVVKRVWDFSNQISARRDVNHCCHFMPAVIKAANRPLAVLLRLLTTSNRYQFQGLNLPSVYVILRYAFWTLLILPVHHHIQLKPFAATIEQHTKRTREQSNNNRERQQLVWEGRQMRESKRHVLLYPAILILLIVASRYLRVFPRDCELHVCSPKQIRGLPIPFRLLFHLFLRVHV